MRNKTLKQLEEESKEWLKKHGWDRREPVEEPTLYPSPLRNKKGAQAP